MIDKLFGRLRIRNSHLDTDNQFKEAQPTLTVPKDSSDKREATPATTDPDVFQKRVAELRLALASPE